MTGVGEGVDVFVRGLVVEVVGGGEDEVAAAAHGVQRLAHGLADLGGRAVAQQVDLVDVAHQGGALAEDLHRLRQDGIAVRSRRHRFVHAHAQPRVEGQQFAGVAAVVVEHGDALRLDELDELFLVGPDVLLEEIRSHHLAVGDVAAVRDDIRAGVDHELDVGLVALQPPAHEPVEEIRVDQGVHQQVIHFAVIVADQVEGALDPGRDHAVFAGGFFGAADVGDIDMGDGRQVLDHQVQVGLRLDEIFRGGGLGVVLVDPAQGFGAVQVALGGADAGALGLVAAFGARLDRHLPGSAGGTVSVVGGGAVAVHHVESEVLVNLGGLFHPVYIVRAVEFFDVIDVDEGRDRDAVAGLLVDEAQE